MGRGGEERREEKREGEGALTFSEAHCTNGRVREHHCRNVIVIQLGIFLPVKQTVSQFPPSSNGHCKHEAEQSHNQNLS